jgi:hypothetical protein
MGCCYGLFPSVAALVCSMECTDEAEGQDHCLHFLESWCYVSHTPNVFFCFFVFFFFLPAFGLTIDSAALELAVLFELPVSMYSPRQRITYVSPILSI